MFVCLFFMRKISILIGCSALALLACTAAGKRAGPSVTTQTLEGDKVLYAFNAEIPHLKGMEDTELQRTVNERLKNVVVQEFRAFVRDVHAWEPETSSGAMQKSILTGTYRAHTIDDNTVSILYVFSPYLAGAAHPNHFTVSFNYDLLNRKDIRLRDLFLKDDYLKNLSALTQERLTAKAKAEGTFYPGKDDLIAKGAGLREDSYSSFAIGNKALLLSFDPYQVGSYAEGIQQVTISGSLLEEHLSDFGKKLLIDTEE